MRHHVQNIRIESRQEIAVAEPILLTGYPRSGNTLAHELLAQACDWTPVLGNLPMCYRADWFRDIAVRTSIGSGQKILASTLVNAFLGRRTGGQLPLNISKNTLLRAMMPYAARVKLESARGSKPITCSIAELNQAMVDNAILDAPADIRSIPGIIQGKHLTYSECKQLFPSIEPLLVIRDPRDVLVSSLFSDLLRLGDDAVMRTIRNIVMSGEHPEEFILPGQLLSQYIGRKSKEILAYFATLPIDRGAATSAIRFESIRQAPIETLKRIDAVSRYVHPGNLESDVTLKGEDAHSNETAIPSFVRGGRVGQWQDYLSSEVCEELPREFDGLIEQFGYDQARTWREDLPSKPHERIVLNRVINVFTASVYRFQSLWIAEPLLQEMYPSLFQEYTHGSFAKHVLKKHSISSTTDWAHWALDIAERLKQESVARSNWESRMGY